ncbi:hypothetical protein B1R94_08895 [Mycolicibacterium litorale]|nr:hypothetical protein B1R94_08895 [Mycolicibacterium litorale]
MTGQFCARRRAIERAASAMFDGRPVLVANGTGTRLTAEVVIAGERATPHWTAWLVRFSSGLLCAPMTTWRAEQLNLPAMVDDDERGSQSVPFGVAVDAARGVTTGISAADRARTAHVLASAESGPDDLVRPGHVLPIRTTHGGVLQSARGSEAAVELCAIGGMQPVALMAALVDDDGEVLRGRDNVAAFADVHGLETVLVEDLVHYRLFHGDGRCGRMRVVRTREVGPATARVHAVDFEDQLTGGWHTAYVGSLTDGSTPTVYVLGECSHGEPMFTPECTCDVEIQACRQRLAAGDGIIVYLRRDRGLASHLDAHQDQITRGRLASILAQLGLPRVIRGTSSSAHHLSGMCDVTVASPKKEYASRAFAGRSAAAAAPTA